MSALFLRRTGAYLVDVVLLFAILAPTGYLIQQALDWHPVDPQAIYATLLLSFSLPSWLYFTWGDASARGQTLGKRLLGLQVVHTTDRPRWRTATLRTLVKVIPWEIAHASAFLIVPSPGAFTPASWIGIGLSYALVLAYAFQAGRSGGQTTFHDQVAGTRVQHTAERKAMQT